MAIFRTVFNFIPLQAKVIKSTVETLSKIKLKWLRSLKLTKNREREGCFLVFGNKMKDELLKDYTDQILLLASTSATIDTSGVPCYLISASDMASLSNMQSDPESVLVVKMPKNQAREKGIHLMLDGIQDPGNLGTIIRTADWFGVSSVICSLETVDCFNPKVVQASMGSIMRVPVTYNNLKEYLEKGSLPVYGALLDGDEIKGSVYPEDMILLIGNEGQGIHTELLPYIDRPVRIPSFGEAESLNAAVATGILLALIRLS